MNPPVFFLPPEFSVFRYCCYLIRSLNIYSFFHSDSLNYWVACTQRSHCLCCTHSALGQLLWLRPAGHGVGGRGKPSAETSSLWGSCTLNAKGRCFLQTKNGLQIILHPQSNSIHWYICSFSRMLGLKGYPRCHPGKPSHLTNEEAEVSRG